ncbi:hypothetical protein FPE01S_02_03670 [Flavihumibacter petaseus NBRC 106054]|uniref:Tetratricopeptide repeat protein n=2 Tax=Flavihumibacter TaxID=1004301 RepID=A0A0E9N0F9_9BACT|nr:hypothetical protein FPE01S_02_03670 [Flavihumibacter petaseus NBRC 106054]
MIWAFMVYSTLLVSFPLFPESSATKPSDEIEKARKKVALTAISCTPDWRTLNIEELADVMIPLPGSGIWKWKISTTSDSAQFYFNQGINCYYGFHIIESVPSFRKAQQFDSACAMLYWGEALALGPNINDFGYVASHDAWQAVQKAKRHLDNASETEKALISAMDTRYTGDSSANQAQLNETYAKAMEALSKKFPVADVNALTVDAYMLLHPWDFWTTDGNPRAWTPALVKLLESSLKDAPMHPGLNHYYIHVVEASPHPEHAAPSADRLGTLTPALSHMLHMPSHIYVRTGRYQEGIKVNDTAVKAYLHYKGLFPDVVNKADLYEYHNRHMQAACAINQNDYTTALRYGKDCQAAIPYEYLAMPVFGYYMQYIYMTPEFIRVAFQRWDEILDQPDMSDSLTYARLLQHFSKGVAYANTQRTKEARQELESAEAILKKDSGLYAPLGPINAPASGSRVGLLILKGAIEENEKNTKAALKTYEAAAKAEDAMIYDEPRDWLLPARHWWGNLLLKSKKFKEAETVFREDLRINPGNPYAEKGIAAARLHKQTIE